GVGTVFFEEMAHHAVATGGVDHVDFHADKTAGRDRGFDHGRGDHLFHVGQLALAIGEILHDGADAIVRHFDPDGFIRLQAFAVRTFFLDDGRAGNEELEAFAAHRFDEHGDLHGAASLDVERAGAVRGVFDVDGDVGLEFAHQTVAQLARGDELAFGADERTVVDRELHLEGRRVDLGEGQGVAIFVGGDGVADIDVLKSGQTDDVAGG